MTKNSSPTGAHDYESDADELRRLEAAMEVAPKGAAVVSGIAVGRVIGGWQARRAALYSSISFAAVVVLYVALRVAETNGGGRFL